MDGALICTIPGAQENVAAPPVVTQPYAFCSDVEVVSDGQTDTYITLYGLAPDGSLQVERIQFDDAAPNSVAASTLEWRTIMRIVTGQYANAQTCEVSALLDPDARAIGRALEDSAGTDAPLKAYIKPNWIDV